MEKTIVAIDPSLTGTAVVCGDAKEYHVTHIKTKPWGKSVRKRIGRYRHIVSEVVQHINAKRPTKGFLGQTEVFIEGYSFYSGRGSSMMDATEYGGILRQELLLTFHVNEVHDVPAKTLKQFVTGKGGAKKEALIARLVKRYGVEFDSNDEFDAFGLYRFGLCATGIAEPETDYQKKALDAFWKMEVNQ